MDEQQTIFAAQNKPSVSNADEFGACSRYRDCSAAGHCVWDGVPEHEYAAMCQYRKRLESGQVFYGKNAAGFSASVYKDILRAVDSLSPEVRRALDAVVLNFSLYHRGTDFMVARRADTDGLENLGLFEIRPLGLDFTRLCGFKELKQAVRSHADYAARYKAAQEARKEELKGKSKEERAVLPGPQTNDFLAEWLNGPASDIRDTLAEPYRAVLLPESTMRYVEELFQDYLIGSADLSAVPENPLTADKLRNLSDREHVEAEG